ncbi:MAG: bacterial regulatory s, luxR family protein [Betaproteobacteria bacterium]|nr:bacterial regulatory s, luxR family protein [Betaproteobacteria bacterium]
MKILVVDDHPLVRDAMSQLVAQLGGDITVLEAPDCAAGLEAAKTHSDIDLVLLDLNLPGLRGIPALDRFRQQHPAMPVVIVSMFRDRETVNEAIRRGAMGFIPKSSSRDTIVNALRLILAGSVYVPPEAATADAGLEDAPRLTHARSAAELGLTARQGQVLALLMKGRSNKQICRELGLAERTVKAHMSAVLNALKVSSRTQAVIAAGRLGLDPDSLLTAADAKHA